MKVVSFVNILGLGGTEKAAGRWAWGLKERGHHVTMLTLMDGPRRAELEQHNVPVQVISTSARVIADRLREISPEVVHAHAPGHPHEGDILGEALALLPRKIPVVQTNIFGKRQNPREDAWTDFRLFISWTACVQAARRTFRRLDGEFFRRCSVAVYPVDPVEPPSAAEIAAFRKQLGVADDEVLFGRLSRPEPNKWTNLALDAFQKALRRNRKIKLLLREPPPFIAEKLRASADARHFIILPATADAEELRLTLAALDGVLHTSLIGESFGYGIAEPMNLGKPVITHSVPWFDQAQIELVRHGECGFVASTPATMADAILTLANDTVLRRKFGAAARQHIRTLADPDTSIARLEAVLRAVVEKRDNPFAAEDLARARATAAYLDAHQFGHSWLEQLALRPFYYRVRLRQFRKSFYMDSNS
ncbi:MAG: glycosyltransferase family 4 protein [Verrucomicrobiota bacterium]|jgi:glycosyltransferase involved in cell wall biosynthesis